MTTIVLDGRRMRTREDTHCYLAKKLSFPSYYGSNLDALYDCLMEMSDTVLTLRYSKPMRKRLGSYGEALCRVLISSAEDNPLISISLL